MKSALIAAVMTGVVAPSISIAAPSISRASLFAEPFDDSNADVSIFQQADAFATFVDYSNMTVGATNFNIPEAPRMIAGSAATRGILLQANVSQGVAAAINIVAGSTPITFTGDYTVSFDAYINLPIPIPTGSTEQLLWGVGSDGADPVEARNNRGSGTVGVWGWLAGDNGYGTEDAAINEDDLELADLGDTQPGEDQFWIDAFTTDIGGPNPVPANSWVRVDIEVAAGNVRVLFNDVEFFSQAVTSTDGFALLGYEDPFTSVGSNPDGQWGLFDNFVIAAEIDDQPMTGLDIRPAGCPNPLNLVSRGVLPAAIAGSAEFDVADIDLSTLALSRADGAAGSIAPLMGAPGPGVSYDDVTTPFDNADCACDDSGPDGFTDLLIKFSVPDLVASIDLSNVIEGDTVEFTITGELSDGTPFEASDCVLIVRAADLDFSGAVDSNDLGLLLGHWGTSDSVADINGDGHVNSGDLGLLLGDWGWTAP